MDNVSKRAYMVIAHVHENGCVDDSPAHTFSHMLYITHGEQMSERQFNSWFDHTCDEEELDRSPMGHDRMIWDSYLELVRVLGV